MYIKENGECSIYLLVYVDDMLVASQDENGLQQTIRCLSDEFELTCLGDVHHFLGMEVRRDEKGYTIGLRRYIEDLLSSYGLSDAKPSKSPKNPGYLKVDDKSEALKDPTKYRSVVGSLLYLSVVAKPNISTSASILGRKVAAPTEYDWTAVKQVLRYLQKTKDYRLHLGGANDDPLLGYSDADWAGDLQSRRSTSGFVFMFRRTAISWASHRQTSVTLSSMEAEYMALSEACQ
ncbi:uncharacterized protein LOC128275964 [Anopheles cruzii]|uniref:uncharacterized protein LOC128275964 n=1 Tax=Anopheles cruzii TaxID=68878 RepID=UPI0022EC2C79|nr:uncharacterized protein LOC128275964 [Anopheles cruzii]